MDRLRKDWRKELLYLGLVGMECCWFYPWHLLVLGARGRGSHLLPLSVLGTLLLALYLTRLLHQRVPSLQAQRLATIVLAILGSLVLLKWHVYPDHRLISVSWLGQFVWEVGNILQSVHVSLLIFLSGLYLWWRGIQIAQQSLDVESVGFGFRLGIIAFLWYFLLRTLFPAPDATDSAFLYFFLGLAVLGLSRIESISHSQAGIRTPFGASWMGILGISALAVSLLSLAIANLLSLRNIRHFIALIRPLLTWIVRLSYPLQIVLVWLLQLLLTALIGLFGNLSGTSEPDVTALDQLSEQLRQFRELQSTPNAPLLLQLIKWAALGLGLSLLIALLALSINRVQHSLEQARDAEHGSAWNQDEAARHAKAAAQERWRRLREQLLERFGRLRGETYSLASIRKTYASLVRLAAASGHPRHEAQTPFEYVATLQTAFPGCEAEVQLITEAYVRAHYGERAFGPRYVQLVREAWLRIRERLERSHEPESSPHDAD